MEDSREHGGDHVSGVPPVPPAGSGGAAGDGGGDGGCVEEDEEEAADGGDEAEGEGEEDAARGGSEEDVVGEEEDLVSVVVRVFDGGRLNQTHIESFDFDNWFASLMMKKMKKRVWCVMSVRSEFM